MRGAYVRLLNCESRFREGYLPVARPINYRLDLSGGSLESYAKESSLDARGTRSTWRTFHLGENRIYRYQKCICLGALEPYSPEILVPRRRESRNNVYSIKAHAHNSRLSAAWDYLSAYRQKRHALMPGERFKSILYMRRIKYTCQAVRFVSCCSYLPRCRFD